MLSWLLLLAYITSGINAKPRANGTKELEVLGTVVAEYNISVFSSFNSGKKSRLSSDSFSEIQFPTVSNVQNLPIPKFEESVFFSSQFVILSVH